MADLIKPEPLRLGDRYYYTLTSYDPVSIEVRVPRVTDQDVDFALREVIAEHEAAHMSPEQLAEAQFTAPADLTDEWVAQEFPGVTSVASLRDQLRRQLEQMNSQATEQSKAAQCAEALAKRLVQQVPADELARTRAALQQRMAADLAREGLTVSDFMRQAGMQQLSLDAMLDEQSRTMAEQNAAIDAFAQERKLKVEDDELPQALGMGMSEANDLIEQAREAGQLEMLRQMAVRVKAMRIVVTECSCSYQMESAEEAAARVAEFQRMLDNAPAFLKRGATADASDAPLPSAGEQRGFKLV